MKQNESKFQDERLSEILGILKRDGRVSVEALSTHFGVSGVTVRNDLRRLEAEGKLTKTFGGALYRETKTAIGLFNGRNKGMVEEKKRIGEKGRPHSVNDSIRICDCFRFGFAQ